MPHSSQVPEPWKSFFGELDREATAETRLDCMGGFVATVLYGLPRATSDLDVLLIAPGEQRAPLLELGIRGGALHRKYKVYLDYVGVAKVPEDYEQRAAHRNVPGGLQASPDLRPRSIRPRVVEARTKHPARSRRRKALGSIRSARLENPQGALRKRASLAAWKSGTGGLNSEALDRNDRGGERRNRGLRQALKDFLGLFSFASQRSAS